MATGALAAAVCVGLLSDTGFAAEPLVSEVSGPLDHGAMVVISGTRFGVKDPPEPALWDDGDHQGYFDSPGAITAPVAGRIGKWSQIHPYFGRYWAWQYRQTPFRSLDGPHPRSRGFMAGGTQQQVTAGPNTGHARATFTAKAAPGNWYMLWYQRMDPRWPTESQGGDRDFKHVIFDEEGYQGPRHRWIFHVNGPEAMASQAWPRAGPRYFPTLYTGAGGGFCSQADISDAYADFGGRPTPVGQWVHHEIVFRKDPGYLDLRAMDNSRLWPYGNSLVYRKRCAGEAFPDMRTVRTWTLGGWFRHHGSGTATEWTNNRFGFDYFRWEPSRRNPLAFHVTGNRDFYPNGNVRLDPPSVDLVSVSGCGAVSPAGDVPSMKPCQYWFGDDDALGFRTLYVRTADGGDPDSFRGDRTVGVADAETNGYTHNDAFWMADDVYVDTTWSRVLLADSVDLARASVIEPQIPVRWSGSAITVRVNLGALPGGEAWVFVFDSANARSGGFPVRLRGGAG